MPHPISFQIHPAHRPSRTKDHRLQILRSENRINGLVAAMDVEATGHQLCCDRKSLELLVELANTKPNGVPGRFGHPGLSENATGKKVQMAINWRTEINRDTGRTYLLHDTLLMDAARTSPAFAQDPVEYILRMAEQQPDQLAESMVLHGNLVWTRPNGQEIPLYEEAEDEEGEQHIRRTPQPSDALTEYPVLRPTKLHFVDFVNEGALTHDGLFPLSTDPTSLDSLASIFTDQNAPNAVLSQLFQTLDHLRSRFNIGLDALPPRIHRILQLYLDARRDPACPSLTNQQTKSLTPNNLHLRKEDSPMTRRQRRQRAAANKFQPTPDLTEEPMAFSAEEETTEILAETDETLDDATAILDKAEAMANNLSRSTAALEQAPALASSTQLAGLQHQVDQNTDQVHALTQQLHKLSELLVRNMELTAYLQRSLSRATGEPTITQSVPLNGINGHLDGFQFHHPAPGAWAAGANPIDVQQREATLPADIDDNSPTAKALRTQQRRIHQQKQS